MPTETKRTEDPTRRVNRERALEEIARAVKALRDAATYATAAGFNTIPHNLRSAADSAEYLGGYLSEPRPGV